MLVDVRVAQLPQCTTTRTLTSWIIMRLHAQLKALVLALALCATPAAAQQLKYPTAPKGDVVDNYGRLRAKGTAVPIREDFSTLDNPFAWPATGAPAAAGLHFVVFTPASRLFHTARNAMDGVLPDGTNLRGTISDAQNGINGVMRATHRQNFVVPPRSHRSFPLVEIMR